MKTKIISKILLTLGLVFVLGSAITQVHGDSLASPQDQQLPVVTIYDTGNVIRGKTGSFVLSMNPQLLLGGTYVNFSVSGTAIPGVDYVALVSAGAEAARLETMLERADREATEREVDLEAILVSQLRELVAAVAARLPAA